MRVLVCFAGVGGSVENVKHEREERVETNDDHIGSEVAEKRVGSSKRSLGEDMFMLKLIV